MQSRPDLFFEFLTEGWNSGIQDEVEAGFIRAAREPYATARTVLVEGLGAMARLYPWDDGDEENDAIEGAIREIYQDFDALERYVTDLLLDEKAEEAEAAARAADRRSFSPMSGKAVTESQDYFLRSLHCPRVPKDRLQASAWIDLLSKRRPEPGEEGEEETAWMYS